MILTCVSSGLWILQSVIKASLHVGEFGPEIRLLGLYSRTPGGPRVLRETPISVHDARELGLHRLAGAVVQRVTSYSRSF